MAVKKSPSDKYVDPLYSRISGNPPIPPTKLRPTIPEPDLRPGGKYNPVKPKNTLDPMFNRKTK
jgi:hypothetical protein